MCLQGREKRETGMKLTRTGSRDMWFSAGKWIGICLTAMAFGLAMAQTVSTTTVQGTVYLANGKPGSGTLQLSWPAFTTSNSMAVAAGRTAVSIGADGFVSVNLAPNLGSSPAGLYYTAVYHMSDGTTSTEYWVVPEAAQANIASVRAQVMPAAQAVQAVNKAYVDQAIESLAQGSLTPVGGSLSGPLYLNGDPTQPLQAADKHYVDSSYSAVVPLSGANMVGPLSAPAVTASVNKVLLVTAPPYNAKCDGVTDDQAAIQAAFNDANSNGYSVEFPAGTCLTSTIVIRGQSFFGHGKYVTTIVGQPGQDVFQAPDPSTLPVFRHNAYIHDLNIQVNASVDASASAAGGNNTFPYRVTGTAGGLTPIASPPAPGPMVFGSPLTCAGQIIADGSGVYDEFYLPCANFANINASTLIGAPISIYNASGALVLSTTIASYIDATHLKLAAAAAGAQGNLSGKYLNAVTPPWYVGNCGMAFPMADGQQNDGAHGMINGWVFDNLAFGQTGTTLRQANHSCAIFMQDNNYATNYEHVDTSMLYGGIIEALPFQNVAYVTWTPDTTKYFDVNLSHHILPLVTYNGTHRILDGVSIYGGAWDSPQGMGAWMLSAPTGSANGLAAYLANASIMRFYFECGSFLSGEVERFTGQSSTLTGGSTTQCGNGGNLGPWMTPAFLNWNVSDGSLDAQIGDFLQINGDHNTFIHTDLTLGAVTDNGFENRVQTGINNSDTQMKRAFYANLNMAQDPVGKLNGDFLLNGNSAAPFVSGSDLLTTCRDYRTLTSLCVNDPNGTELVKSYIHAPASGGTVAGISTGSVAAWNLLMTAGSRIPLTPVYVVAQGRCEGASSCSSSFTVRDRVTSATIGSCTYTFGSSWTIQGGPSSNPCLVNFANVPQGDAVGWDTNSWTASGLTAVDISFVGFQPQNADVVSEVVTSGQLAGVIQSGAAGAPVNINAANWRWVNNSNPGVVDPSSPVGYSTAISNAWGLYAWNGSTNLNGGALYPAVPSTISYLVQAPTVLTNTLALTMAATDSSMTVTVPTTSAYASSGCFQVDQEIVCNSGALTAGSTTIAVSRGQYGTLAQAHASGTTVSTVGTGSFYAACNSTNYATTNLVFGANWSYVSSPFAAQNCSGANTNIHLAFANGPVGQTYKIAAVQIAQNPGNPQATAANQVPLSASAGNSQYGWTNTKSLAGNGAAIPTGPASSTAGNLATFANGNGQLQDGGVAVSSLASLATTNTQTFAGSLAFGGLNQHTKPSPLGTFPGPTHGYLNFARVANEYFSNVYTAPMTDGSVAYTAIGLYDLFLDGGYNQSQNGWVYKPGLTGLSLKLEGHAKGSLNPISVGLAQYGVGDTFGIYNIISCWGGTTAGGDEGCENNDEETFQGNVDFQGPLTAGAGTGSTSITVNPTQGGASFPQGPNESFGGTQGAGRWVLDLNATGLITAGTITNLVTNPSSFTTYTGTGTSWPVSTVNTTLGTAVTSAGTFTVTPASMSGITTSTVLCIADGGNFETLIPAAVTGTTFTASFLKPFTSAAIVAAGGLCGYSIEITGDIATGGGITGSLHVTYPVIRSTSTTSLDAWLAMAGNWKAYPGTWSASANHAYTLYPSAEALSVSNGTQQVTNTLTLAPNTVAWTNGDIVDQPIYPWLAQDSGNTIVTRYISGGNAYGRNYTFGPYQNQGWGLTFNNTTAPSYYVAANNRIAPIMIGNTGEWLKILDIGNAPDEAVIRVAGCAASGTCGTYRMFETGASGVGSNFDYMQYNQTTGIWGLTAGGLANTYFFGPTGINSSSAITFGVSAQSTTIRGSGNISIGTNLTVNDSNGSFSTTGTGTVGTVKSNFIGPADGSFVWYHPDANWYIRDQVNSNTMFQCNPGAGAAAWCGNYGSAQFKFGGVTVYDQNGVKHEGGTAPTVSAGTITGTNAAGFVSGLNAATSVTITFANSGWTNWASCTASPSVSLAAAPYVSAISKTAVTFTFPSLTGTLYYQCGGN